MNTKKPDKKAFSEQIEKHQAIIHKITFVYAHNSFDRQDLFQEICLQLWKSYPRFRAESKFTTWMYRVAINTAISKIRQNKQKPVFEALNENDQTAEDNNNKEEQVKLLNAAIARLNNIDKAIILLWMEEKSYDEIATIMGTSKNNISVKLVRIKKKLEEWVRNSK